MDTPYETYDVASNEHNYRVQYWYDHYADPPWQNSDGHGDVRIAGLRDRQSHEVSLPGGYYYDWKASLKKAEKEAWGLSEEEAVGLAPKQIREKAVQKDFDYLKGWCNGDWHYVVVTVFPLDLEGNELKSRSQSLAGIESTDEEYLKQVAFDLIEEILKT